MPEIPTVFSRGSVNPELIAPRFPKPPVNRQATPNFDQGRSGAPVIGICYHIAAGQRSSVINWFAASVAQVSAHFLVCRDGTIDQFVDCENIAWTQGIVKQPSWPLFDQYQGRINRVLIGIEHEGQPGWPWTEAEYQADLALSSYLCERYWINPVRPYLLGHNELDTVSRANCPGPNFPWQRLLADLQTRFANLVRVELPTGKCLTGELRDGHTWVQVEGIWCPLRAWAETLGFAVDWQAADGALPRAIVKPPTTN